MTEDYLLAFIAATNLGIAFITYLSNRQGKETKQIVIEKAAQAQRVADETNKNVEVIEKATNSIVKALVDSTERSAMAEGLAKGKAEGLEQAREAQQKP